MYKNQIYKDEKGKEPITEYLNELSKNKSKDSRIKLNKILEYIKVLQRNRNLASTADDSKLIPCFFNS